MRWTDLEEVLSITRLPLPLPLPPVAGDRPAPAVQLMAALLYLKHAHTLLNDATCIR